MRVFLAAALLATLVGCSTFPKVDSYVPERFLSDSHLPDSVAGLPVAVPAYELKSCAALLAERAEILREIGLAESMVRMGLITGGRATTVLGQPLDAIPEEQREWLIGLARARVEAINSVTLKRGCQEAPIVVGPVPPVAPVAPAARPPIPGVSDPIVVPPYVHVK
ncbi:hypothetical protein [Cognatishimia sp. F0-27]|uniref:hypothetical protein n=1 Tax=Cognatishimia sp. F0-27 TaxID=2816855 RepID=UPI001D0C9B4E|nr:hypothetical protein [Cognatishimia sp. F0-27]MCC1495019.1 hypothetical protein [Cognatishimia sp. F0-27]